MKGEKYLLNNILKRTKMAAEVDTLHLLTQPELTENRTARKSDNQGDKKETFIQTSRRGGNRQSGQRGLVARRRIVERVRPGCN